MKHSLLWLLAFVFASLFVSCSKSDGDGLPQPEAQGGEAGLTRSITFSVANYLQGSLENGYGTRVGDLDSLAHLAMAVYTAEGARVKLENQNKGTKGYGTFSVALPFGEYEVVFLGYNGNSALLFDGVDNIHFAKDYVPDLFLNYLPLTVDAEMRGAQSIVLSRRVSAFGIKCTDEAPSTIDSMFLAIHGGGTVLNARTGCAMDDLRTGKSVVSAFKGKTGYNVNSFFFVPSSPCTVDVEMTFKQKNGTVVMSRLFKDVPAGWNKWAAYVGNFFTADAFTPTVSYDTFEWDRAEYNF